MTRLLFPAVIALVLTGAAGCDNKPSAEALPKPQEVSANAIAEFCNMAIAEHPGPKAQIFVKSKPDHPFWFASVRDAFAFTMLPEEPKDIAVIYVNDMARAKSWAHAEQGGWVDAHKAVFVIASRKLGGMGENEAVPFSDDGAARSFIAENGGRLVRFNEMPEDYILSTADAASDAGAPAPSGGHHADTASEPHHH